jgi:ParB family transcriptional regulator, chromosome partitioning protein
MSKNIRAILAEKLAANTQRHAAAHQEAVVEYGRTHTMISVDVIDPNPYQPRKVFPQEEIESLAQSIGETGLLQPITIRPNGDRYQLIAGERRLRAHKLLGKPTIEALISEAEEGDMAVFALAENIDREDLSDYEIGKALRQVDELFPNRKRLAESLGLVRQDLYRYFAYDDLPAMIKDRLNINPRLLGRGPADALKRVLAEEQQRGDLPPDTVESCLMGCWQQLENAELDQTKLPAQLQRALMAIRNEGRTLNRDVIDITRVGKRVGTIVRDPRHIVVKIQAGTLSEEQELELERYVQTLVSQSVSQIETQS